jgi:hypothetical protein
MHGMRSLAWHASIGVERAAGCHQTLVLGLLLSHVSKWQGGENFVTGD